MADGLVDAAVLGDKPEVDRPEFGEDLTGNTGLLLDFAHRGLLGRLARLDVALRQRPQQPPLPVGAPDQRPPRHAPGEVDDQPAGAEFVDLTQPATGPPALLRRRPTRLSRPPPGARLGALGHVPMVTAGSVRWPSVTPRAPLPDRPS
jgi:hypothetical protein